MCKIFRDIGTFNSLTSLSIYLDTCEDNQLGNFSSLSGMEENGWRFENISTNEHTCMIEDPGALAECNSSISWYGWGCGSSYGVLSTTLNGSGIMKIQYGNCLGGGGVQVYVNDSLQDSASSHRYKQFSFEYDEGTKLSILDHGSNAAIKLISVSFACKGKYTTIFSTTILFLKK